MGWFSLIWWTISHKTGLEEIMAGCDAWEEELDEREAKILDLKRGV